MKGENKKRIKKNPAALISVLILMVGAFLFPISKINLFGASVADRNYVLFNLIEDFISKPFVLEGAFQILPFLMSLCFLLIFLMYLLNGFGLVFYKYSRWASYLTFLYLFFGLWLINKLNLVYGSPTVGSVSNYTAVGIGIWIVPFIGLFYIIFARNVNRKIRF